MKKAIQIDPADNVATATSDFFNGETVEVLGMDGSIILKPVIHDDIKFGHKLSLKEINPKDKIIKYGEIIGVASKKIEVGRWIHTHNMNSARLHVEGKKAEGEV